MAELLDGNIVLDGKNGTKFKIHSNLDGPTVSNRLQIVLKKNLLAVYVSFMDRSWTVHGPFKCRSRTVHGPFMDISRLHYSKILTY